MRVEHACVIDKDLPVGKITEIRPFEPISGPN
jgi:hypothetical protein